MMTINNPFKITLRPVLSVLLIITFMGLSVCSGPSGIMPEKILYQESRIEACIADSANTYHILVPEATDPSIQMPLVIVLDAHGNGRMAVDKFRPAIRYFSCLVAGSDRIRNNFQGFEKVITQLLADIRKKYPVDDRYIIISGFSGGARMAYYYTLRHPVSGVLMCGAGPGDQLPSCPVCAISGMGDFNFAEQYRHPDILSFSDDRFTSDYFHGIHEWPQPQQLLDALVYLLRDNPGMKKLKQYRVQELFLLSDSLAGSGDELLAWKALEKAAKLSSDRKDKQRAIERGNAMKENEDFRKTIRSLENDLNTEGRLQQAYSQRMMTADFEWWKNELTVLNKMLDTHKTGIKADHYLRVKGFIGIMLYSMVNNMIRNDPGNPQLEVMLDTYEFAEPENPDPYYFKALHAWQSGDRQSCIKNLDRALELGFSDRQKLRSDFPEEVLNQFALLG